MKTLLIIPDGVGIRNFLCTPFLDHLLDQGEVVVWHDLPQESVRSHQREGLRWAPLPPVNDGLPVRVLRKARNFAQLYWQRDPGTEETLKKARPSGAWHHRLIDHTARLVGRLAAGRGRIEQLDALYERLVSRAASAFRAFVEAEQPDVAFCTHQRAWRAAPAMQVARDAGVPAATFIYSWDNLPKNRSAVLGDAYFVWGPRMKEEMHRYYPSLKASQVKMVGTPQFESHFRGDLLADRQAFLEEVGLDPDRPVVCFSGDDVLTSPHDPAYLRDLAAGLRAVPAQRRPQILFRRCPVDASGRYDPVLEEYPEIAASPPAWAAYGDGRWKEVVPTVDDVALLSNVVHHCEVVVNLGSTMALDFAVCEKPAVFVRYEPVPPAGNELGAQGVYRLPHFAVVHEHDPVYWADSPQELCEAVLHALAHPEEKKDACRAWVREIARRPLDQASRRCAEALGRMASRSPAAAEAFRSVEAPGEASSPEAPVLS